MSLSNTKPLILICGAGLGGLMAALALLKKGYPVKLFEQASALGDVGAGIQMSANGSRLIFEMGLGKELMSIACIPTGKEIRLWSSGKAWPLFDLGTESVERYGFPYVMVHRADLHAILVKAVQTLSPDCIVLNAKGVSFEENENVVTLQLDNGERHHGAALIGSDGVHSKIRQQLIGNDSPVFTGCMAWRGLIPTNSLPEHLQRRVGVNWVGPGRHVVHYPIRRGELVNFVGIVEKDSWQIESWNQMGTKEECTEDFKGWNDDIHTLIANIQTPYKWALMGREPLKHWSKGVVSLLGDACHPTLPFLAQGAMMALEDGIVLARCIERNQNDIESALIRYANVRLERTNQIVIGSTENAKRFHNPKLRDLEGANEYVNSEWTIEKINARYNWLFEYDATKVDLGN